MKTLEQLKKFNGTFEECIEYMLNETNYFELDKPKNLNPLVKYFFLRHEYLERCFKEIQESDLEDLNENVNNFETTFESILNTITYNEKLLKTIRETS